MKKLLMLAIVIVGAATAFGTFDTNTKPSLDKENTKSGIEWRVLSGIGTAAGEYGLIEMD